MELVEGPTLGDRIRHGPLGVDEALEIARQIAEALEAAHENGRVHRDLKPANVKITTSGIVKLLDFGLAKGAEAAPADPHTSAHAELILGTAAYMSPEQARGAAVDKRADIWAFGVVLYEMLTGRRPFAGDCIADVLASVVKYEPDLSLLPPGTAGVVGRCLSKEPRNRWGSMGDVRWALEVLPKGLPASVVPASRKRYIPWAAAALLTIVAAAIWFWKPKPAQPLLQMEITAPEGTTLGPVRRGQLALSPDGRQLAFIAMGKDGKSRLWLQRLSILVAR
jgi:serine/threonine-protein kinase